MKKLLCFALTLFAVFSFTQTAEAKIPFFYSTGAATQEIHKFEEPIDLDGDKAECIGIVFDQFSIFTVPIWNYGEQVYALYTESGNTINYYELTPEDVEAFSAEFGIELDPNNPTLSFWNRIGGKLVLLLVFVALVGYYMIKGDDDDEEAAA